MAAYVYGSFPLRLVKGEVDLDTATVKALLVGSGYVFDADTHDYRDDVTGELTGTGYTAGGVTLTGVSTVYDAATNKVKVDAADAAFGTVTLTGVTGLVTYLDTGTAGTSPLMSYHSFASQSPNGVPFTYAWHADGICTLSV